ncbi:MAG: TRAP transporter large permease subunit, partial [Desulfonatronovibrionaceae bacterium]
MGLTLFIIFLLLMFLGVPIALAIGLASAAILIQQGVPLTLVVQRMFSGVDNFSLIAVPLFILAGDIMARGEISKRLVEFADALLGFLKGGLSIVAVAAGMFFAAISGSGAASTAAIGSSLVPELKRKGY